MQAEIICLLKCLKRYIMNKKLLFTFSIIFSALALFAGNPDRQGEAGAGELLFNPWARSAGIHTMNTSSISGVEAMRLNVAGIGRIEKRELLLGNTRLYEGSTLGLNAGGFVTKVGENGALGFTLTAVDFGDNFVTTTDQPGGTGATFSPGYFHLGVGYAHTYENKISVGVLFRSISESLTDVSALGFAVDAGVQYVSGDNDEFKLGISLRNVGTPMQFKGPGLATQVDAPDAIIDYGLTLNQRADVFELPSALNVGLSYDIHFSDQAFLRILGNFTSNAFARDQIGGGAEIYLLDKFALRGAYKYELQQSSGTDNIYDGFAGGVSFDLPLKKAGDTKLGLDYAYRTTRYFRGSHNISLRLSF